MKFIITNHARQRFVERFSVENHKTYLHLSQCKKRHNCELCISLTWKLHQEVEDGKYQLDDMMQNLLKEAKETRIHYNNTELMSRLHLRYGYKKFYFLIAEDVLFVVLATEEGEMVVTCMDAKNSHVGDFVRRPKYRKKV